MPLSEKGRKIMASLVEQYGEEKAKKVFYAGKNSGRFTGVDSDESLSMTETVFLDQAHFKKTADGYLVAQPRVARTGIQVYSPKEVGKHFDRMVRVYRPEDEVFSQDTIRSFAHRPITLDHPPEMVNDANWKKYAKGHTIDPIVRDGEFVRVPIMLMDQEVIKAFESGRNQLSMGYTCDLKWEPGVTDEGEEYDAVQCNLRMNHLALVSNARGGEKLRIGDADEEFDLVHCPDCDALVQADAESCPVCGYEMQDGEELELATDEEFNDWVIPVRSGNPNRQAGNRFGPKEGGGEAPARERTRKPSTTAKKSALEEHGYSLTKAGSKYGVKYPPETGGGHSGNRWLTKEEAVAHAEEHAKQSGLLEEPARPPPPPRGPGATASPVHGPRAPRSGESLGFGEPDDTTLPAPHSGQRQAAATAAAVGVTAPGEATEKGSVGRPRAKNPDGTFVHPRPGETGYAEKAKAGARASAAGAGAEPGFSAGKTTFKTRGEALRHIRMQRRRWWRAKPAPHSAVHVARTGFGFLRGEHIPGLRKRVKEGYYTVHHYDSESPWTIMFDEELDFLPLTDVELTLVEDFNPNHDPQTGEFTSNAYSSLGLGAAGLLRESSRREAASSTFSTPEIAKQHAAMQLQTWKKHLASQEEAVREIKKNIAYWEKAKVRPHVEYETKKRLGGLLGEKRKPVRTHYTVHVDSADLELIDAIELSDIDIMQIREWEDQLLLEQDSSDPAMDEMAEPADHVEGQPS